MLPIIFYLFTFFDWLERDYGVRIVIAAHPKSLYDRHPDYFGGRPALRGKTAELVRKSGFVLTHGSTALNFAVLFNKPLLFITTYRLQQSLTSRYLFEMARWLGKAPINLDEPLHLDWQKELTIEEQTYGRYRNAYIKKVGSPEKPCWQIFADFLKTLNS